MKKLILFLFAALTCAHNLQAQEYKPYHLLKSIPLPGDGGYDYLSIDSLNQRLYVSHGTQVQVLSLATEQPIGAIAGMKGVHGIAIVNHVNKGFITDGKANAVVVFDLKTFHKLTTLPLKNADGPDAITYDPYSDRVFTFNGESDNASVIDPNTLQLAGLVKLGGGPESGVPDGRGKIYNNLEDKSSLDVIDTKTLKVIHSYGLAPCGGPTGIAFDPAHQRLFSVCRENKGMSVVDARSGKVILTLPIGGGVDAVAYDAATGLIFCSNGDGATTIIQQSGADSYKVVQTLPTKYRAKTMALDRRTHKIYLSVAAYVTGTKNIVPGTFEVLVYGQ